ncbi:MAG TPA: hypothetical protein VNA69_23200 [Thermoanaerobaculia bacterium]|nr:hypothetical protein [Thermoanaerobaculia bacterium]
MAPNDGTKTSLADAAANNDAHAALLAVSTTASPSDVKKGMIFNCIVSEFFAQGFPAIITETARIVWSTIDDDVIILLGNGITNCITARGFTCPALAPPFQNLKNMGQVTVVRDLVTALAALVRP